MFHCLVSTKYVMTARVLSQDFQSAPSTPGGHYETYQDPDTGSIRRVWVSVDADLITDGVQPYTINVMARGIVSGALQGGGTTEHFMPNGIYESIDYVRLNFGPEVKLTKRDRITDITNSEGVVVWKEEEDDNKPTVFDVLGVTPIVDPFGTHVENFALIKRADVQDYQA